MSSEQFDLEDQQEIEQQETEDEKFSKEVYKKLKSQKQYQKAIQEEAEKLEKTKHKAKFTRRDNENCYICDNCGQVYKADKGTLIYNKKGEFAYCDSCLKILYPNYRRVSLFGAIKKTDYRDNHCDTAYSKGF